MMEVAGIVAPSHMCGMIQFIIWYSKGIFLSQFIIVSQYSKLKNVEVGILELWILEL